MSLVQLGWATTHLVTCSVHRLDFGEISKRIRLVQWHHLFAKIVLAFTF